ncbi:MAG: glutamate-1-semialdehyde 2,1-aminomutase [Blastocatellia bacterium]|nr:glutamate-1-semialdehyde 2,1-aminomutase [Blastocatellia bacterium]
METPNSKRLFADAIKHMPGGVNSPVRAFKSVGGDPIYMESAQGSQLVDVDGNEYIDYIGSWGPMILGHAHPEVTAAITAAAIKGTSFGTNSEGEVELAKLVKKFVPAVEIIRMVNSGTEATMSAMRLARGYTSRNRIIKFEGCYHGHGDSFLSKAGSGVATLGLPDSPGVTPSTAADTLNAVYNDIGSVRAIVEQNHGEIAAVFIEPIAGNMGCVPADSAFLQDLRDICTAEGIVLIFDEVMTGFRVSAGGAQGLYGTTPDLTTFGKIIGGGLPVGAYGGRREIMELIAPAGPVYQAGTLSGNPLAMAAGIATLSAIDADPEFYKKLEQKGRAIEDGIRQAAGEPLTFNRVGSMFTLFFSEEPVTDFSSAKTSDAARFARFFNALLEAGVYFPPSQFEACFISVAHSESDIEQTISAITDAIAKSRG